MEVWGAEGSPVGAPTELSTGTPPRLYLDSLGMHAYDWLDSGLTLRTAGHGVHDPAFRRRRTYGRAQANTGRPLVGVLEREEPDGEVGGTGGASHRAGVEGRPSARPACSELIRLCVKDDRVVMFPALGDAIRLPAGSLSHGIDLKPVQLQAA